MRKKLAVIAGLALAALRSGAACGQAAAPAPADPVLVGAGDIASCKEGGDEQTAALLDTIDGTVFTLGDNVYSRGTPRQFMECYEPSWGRHKARTRPVPGNHDYRTAGAAGYFGYFGGNAGDPATGYYSYDLGKWHIIVLNSNCGEIGGCGPGSRQEQWLKADLAAHPAPCTASMFHHPRYSSSQHGNDSDMKHLWRILYEAGVEIALSGHDHTYERFGPRDALGRPDPERGIRQFVVGTGGKELYRFYRTEKDSDVRSNKTFGVLKLTLRPDAYDWEFVPVAGGTFTDKGSGKCH